MPSDPTTAIICPGQGAQRVGMGSAWRSLSEPAQRTFAEADEILGDLLGAPLSELCREGPESTLNRTDVSQPAIFTCSVACYRALLQSGAIAEPSAAAGLSLGEYTALHIAGVFAFDTGLHLVADRGRLMQEAAERSQGSMVALIGAEEEQAEAICRSVTAERADAVLVPANFNAPGQIVLSGDAASCGRAVEDAGERGLRATPLTVAGAFHSPLMQPAADRMAEVLASVELAPPRVPVWSNVTAQPHDGGDPELLRRRLVEQIVQPVRWSQCCQGLVSAGYTGFHELAPGTVLRGLMRRIDRTAKVQSHDEPTSEP